MVDVAVVLAGKWVFLVHGVIALLTLVLALNNVVESRDNTTKKTRCCWFNDPDDERCWRHLAYYSGREYRLE